MLGNSAENVRHVARSIPYYSDMFCFVGEVDWHIVDSYKVTASSKFYQQLIRLRGVTKQLSGIFILKGLLGSKSNTYLNILMV